MTIQQTLHLSLHCMITFHITECIKYPIFVNYEGEHIAMEIEPDITLHGVRTLIADHPAFQTLCDDNFSLWYGGERLIDEGQQISDHGIGSQAVVDMVLDSAEPAKWVIMDKKAWNDLVSFLRNDHNDQSHMTAGTGFEVRFQLGSHASYFITFRGRIIGNIPNGNGEFVNVQLLRGNDQALTLRPIDRIECSKMRNEERISFYSADGKVCQMEQSKLFWGVDFGRYILRIYTSPWADSKSWKIGKIKAKEGFSQ